jgi:hypothetical protein
MRIWRLIFARQLVHSNIAREILHTVPEVFHIVPEIFHIVPEIFRIVSSQFFAIFRPQERSRRFLTVSTVPFLGIGGVWLTCGFTGPQIEPEELWRDPGIQKPFGHGKPDLEFAWFLESRCTLIQFTGPSFPVLFFPGDSPQLHQEHRWCISFITGRNQLADLFMLLMISIPPIFLKEFWVGCCGLYYFGNTTELW